ncbi:MAG: hypothetical protein RW306_16230 [Geobacteraceae bacterium]|nr:hypothetical protein [Geobacteraceae bacterium]
MKNIIIISTILFFCSIANAKESTVYSFALANNSDVHAYGYYKFGAHTGTVGTLRPGKAAHEGFMPFSVNVRTEIVFTCETTGDNEEVCATAEVDLQKYLPKGKKYKYVETIFRLEKDKSITLSFETEEISKKVSTINIGKLPVTTGNPKAWVDRLR